jgi:hypothetical protein
VVDPVINVLVTIMSGADPQAIQPFAISGPAGVDRGNQHAEVLIVHLIAARLIDRWDLLATLGTIDGQRMELRRRGCSGGQIRCIGPRRRHLG